MNNFSILHDPDYYRPTPPVGYLSAAARKSDADCVNHSHLAEVLRARRDRDNYAHPSGGDAPGSLHLRAGHGAPSLPAPSIVERESAHPWRWVGAFAWFVMLCGGLFAPAPVRMIIAFACVGIACAVLARVIR